MCRCVGKAHATSLPSSLSAALPASRYLKLCVAKSQRALLKPLLARRAPSRCDSEMARGTWKGLAGKTKPLSKKLSVFFHDCMKRKALVCFF